MFINEMGLVISCSGGCPDAIGRHWKYISEDQRRGVKEYRKLYSSDGIYWYAFGMDVCVAGIGKEVNNAEICSLWEMFYTKKLYTDKEFVEKLGRFINIDELRRNIKDEDAILEGLLS